MKISGIGEHPLIRRLEGFLSRALPPRQDVLVGIGDDTALLRVEAGYQLLTTDDQIEGVHFSRATVSPADLGWKALAVNLSDIAAMGGRPQAALVALSMPADTEVAWVDALYQGLAEAALASGVAIVGGDTGVALVIMISVSLTGTVDAREDGSPRALLRSGARPGDLLAVTGALGDAAGGLRLLSRGSQPVEGAEGAALVHAQRRPPLRIDAGQVLAEEGVRAAIDVSDGLLADLGHLCRASSVSATVRADLLPLSPALLHLFPKEATHLALTGGEDYELLFAAPFETVERVRKRCPVAVTIVGEVSGGPTARLRRVTLRDAHGILPLPERLGWRHF
ncbi:MAG: thiamine-phosphate kinase [Chloroflexi bacterium]|nr:thiamine-phosphate kinase [Chloroflexota bacterium]